MFRNQLVAAAVLALGANAAYANPTVYFGEDTNANTSFAAMTNSAAARATFLSNLINVGNEDFEGFGAGNANNLNLNFGAAGTATLSSTNPADSFIRNSEFAGRFATSGSQYFETRAGGGTSFTVTFSQPVAAFGFYGTDFGDFAGQMSIQLAGGSNLVMDIPHTVNAPNGAGLFFGLISFNAADVFTSITFSSDTNNDAFGFDDMVVGGLDNVLPIPLPSAAAMGLGGMFLVGGIRRRRN